MVAAASEEWQLAKSNTPAELDHAAVPAIDKAELRKLLVIASATKANPGLGGILANGLTSTATIVANDGLPLSAREPIQASIMRDSRRSSAASIIQERTPSVAEHPLLGGLECYDITGDYEDPVWRPLAAATDGFTSASATGESSSASSGSEMATCLGNPAEHSNESHGSGNTGSPLKAAMKWFQPGEAVKVMSSLNTDRCSRARVLLVDRVEGRYKVRDRDGSIRTVPADQVGPLKLSLKEVPLTIKE